MTCQRCEEKFKPIDLRKDWPTRLQGKITIRTYSIFWSSIWFGNTPSLDRPRHTKSEMTLCDECWASLLQWATQPEQERRKIAAENRRSAERRVRVAEERREREIQRIMREEGESK